LEKSTDPESSLLSHCLCCALASLRASLSGAACLGRTVVVQGWKPRDWGCVQAVSLQL